MTSTLWIILGLVAIAVGTGVIWLRRKKPVARAASSHVYSLAPITDTDAKSVPSQDYTIRAISPPAMKGGVWRVGICFHAEANKIYTALVQTSILYPTERIGVSFVNFPDWVTHETKAGLTSKIRQEVSERLNMPVS